MDLSSEIINYYRDSGLSAENLCEDIKIVSLSSPSVNSEEDPFVKFFTQLGESLKKDKREKKTRDKKRKQIEEAAQSLAKRLREMSSSDKKIEKDFFEKTTTSKDEKKQEKFSTSEPPSPEEKVNLEEEKPEKINFKEEKTEEEKFENFNPYVDQLKKGDSKHSSEPPSRFKKITDMREFIGKEISKQFDQFQQQFPNFSFGSSGGGTNAVQFAQGGTMNGNLNVTGKYLSGGRDLIEIFSTLSGNGGTTSPSNKLINEIHELILNSDGTISFPLSNTIISPENSLLNLESQSSLGTFTKIVLSPYGFFAYDQNSNSISFDSIDNDIVLVSQDQHEWKFNSEGILVGPESNGVLAVSGLNSLGRILSGGIDVAELIQSIPQGPIGNVGPTGSMGPVGESAFSIWLGLGNTGDEQTFLNSLKGTTGATGATGSGATGATGATGASVYEIWLSNNNTGSEQIFLSSLKGEPGIQGLQGVSGLNVFEVWLSAGNVGTFTDFLNSIKGDKGEEGIQGVPGLNSFEIWLSAGNQGDFNAFLTSIAPVKSVAGKTEHITLDISDINNLETTLNTKQLTGDYVELVDGKIPTEYLPAFVDEIQEFTNFDNLTSTGTQQSNVLYVTINNNKIYRWGGSIYVEIVGSPGSTDSIVEGSINKYFTEVRAAEAAPVQTVAGKIGNVILGINDITNLNTQLTSTNVTTSTFQVKAVSQGIYNDGVIIPAGTSLETIIRNMLITQVPPTYNAPLLSVAYGSPSIITTYEVGFTIPTFTIIPTYTQRDGGSLVGYAYYRNNSFLGNGSTFTVNSFQVNSTTTLQVSARYNDGPIYNDNLGNPYPSTSIKAGSIINTVTINTLYPYFYGKSSTQPTAATIASEIQTGTATKVLADANGTVSITYNANGEYIWFAHLGTQTTKTKWYFTALNSGDIANGNFINLPVAQNVSSPESYWTNIQYKVYISSGLTSTTGALEFRNS